MTRKLSQCRKPHGEEGIKTIKNMNKNHIDISNFAFECINIKSNDKILDIGCGGGVNIEKFLKITKNNVDGLDYSEVSVQESIKRNINEVNSERCNIIQADVSNMPIEDEKYNLISAFETVYFWPDLNKTFKEVFRLIKPNGHFMIAQGTDGNHPDDEKWLNTVEGMKVYTASELETYLNTAGFSTIKTFKKEGEHILVVIAKK